RHLAGGCVAVALSCSAGAVQAVPQAFTAKGEGQTFQAGKPERPMATTIHYAGGKLRIEMAGPVGAQGGPQFNIILAQEGVRAVTLLNPAEKTAMKMDLRAAGAAGDQSLDFTAHFQVRDYATTFRARSKVVGRETIAGEPCTVREQRGKDGHVKVWLSDRYEVPFRLTYLDRGKAAYTWTMKQFTPGMTLPASAFSVPAGFETVDLSEMMEGLNEAAKHPPRPR
ncbi:MAG: DUF4412 domain-containing protein, partial [Candidatus Sericytochromatia bacterium]|nr:DUF4412 domain-containing protein [Candidatus Sericytochromatia bacterium]